MQPQTPVSEQAFTGGSYKAVQERYPGFDLFARALFESRRLLFPPRIPTAAGAGTLRAHDRRGPTRERRRAAAATRPAPAPSGA